MKDRKKAPFDSSSGSFVDEAMAARARAPGRTRATSPPASERDGQRYPDDEGQFPKLSSPAAQRRGDPHSQDSELSAAASQPPPTRRGLLVAGASGVAALAGGALAAHTPTPTSATSSATALGTTAATALQTGADLGWEPRFLSADQARLLSRLCDLLLPRTDTPGALDAGVPEWIDLALSVDEPDEQLEFLGGLAWLGQRCQREHGHPFLGASAEQQQHMLREISDESAAHADDLEPGAAFFRNLKGRTLFAYFTSEKGRTEYLGLPAEVRRERLLGCQHDSH